ncbi:MAG: hypothetical protein ABWW66_00410 [Archaeoglobaceae archaeon]
MKLLRIIDYDVGQLRRMGENIWRLSYGFNKREGVGLRSSEVLLLD